MSIHALNTLKSRGFIPALVVTTPDKPQGRKLTITPNVVKSLALDQGIKVISPEKINDSVIAELQSVRADVFIVASYGKILPKRLIDLPRAKTLNIHPSLLPAYRGASPLQSAMLDDAKNTGVTVMQIDAEMDHGPVVAQKNITVPEWPAYEEFEKMMAEEGASLLADVLPEYVAGKIVPKEQDHSKATYTKKFEKSDGLLDLQDDPYLNFRKIQAFHEWPQAYFIINHHGREVRVKVTAASFKDNKLIIERVIPEGGKEMAYGDFERGYRN